MPSIDSPLFVRRAFSAPRSTSGVLKHGVHCGAEHRGLLDLRHPLERPHHVNRPGRLNLDDRPAGEDLLQLPGRAHGRQLAGIDDRDPMAMLGFIQIVRRDENRHAFARQVLDETPELAARDRIDASRRLVEKHDPRLVQDGAAEREPLTPASGKIARLRVFAARKPRHLEDERSPLRDSVVAQSVDRAEESDVLIDGQRLVQRELLRHVPDAPLHFFRVAADVDPIDRGGARGRLQQPAHHADGGRLAGAVRAEKAEDLPALDREADAIDGDEAAELPRQIADDDGLPGRSSPSQRPIQPGGRELRVRERAREIELRLQQRDLRVSTSVLVATPAPNRSASTRRASAAARTPIGRLRPTPAPTGGRRRAGGSPGR